MLWGNVFLWIFCLNSNYCFYDYTSIAKFIVTWMGDIVDSGLGLSYRPASVDWRAVQQHCAGVTFIPPVRNYEFGYKQQSLKSKPT